MNVYLAPAASCSTAEGRTARGRRRGSGGGDGSRASAHSLTASSAPRDSAKGCLSSSARTYMYVSARSRANIIANCRTGVLSLGGCDPRQDWLSRQRRHARALGCGGAPVAARRPQTPAVGGTPASAARA
eukprot:COSAG01_NODE_1117_length_11634_cov_26.813611_10_plen_130_part_00